MIDPEVPEADALDQMRTVDHRDETAAMRRPPRLADPEVPEADAVEQAEEVPFDDDEPR